MMKVLLLIDVRGRPFPEIWYNKLKELSINVKVLSFYNTNFIASEDYIKIQTKMPAHRLKMIYKIMQIKKIVKSIKPDIIHSIQITRQGFLASLINWHPYIVTAIGSDVFIEPQHSKIEKYIVQKCFNNADLITSMAEHMTDYIKSNFKVDGKKLITFPWGCDTRIFNIQNREVNETEQIIICPRQMDNKIYNQETLINAIPLVLKKIPTAKFVFIGGGYLLDYYKRLSANLGVENNTLFLGWQTPIEIANWLKKSMIFISVALSDGNNISLNEAMACGCFPICSDIPACRQWYNDDISGFLIPPRNPNILAEKIIAAIQNKDLRDRAITINSETIKQRGDWHLQMPKMIEIYKSLLKNK